MANIFIAFHNSLFDEHNSNKMPCFYESFINGIKENGNNVIYWHDAAHWNQDFEEISLNLLNQIKSFEPDLIILFNNYFYDISKEFECPIIIYEVDSPLYYSNKETLKRKANRYKYFLPQSDSIDILKNDFGVNKKNICMVYYFSSIKNESKDKNINISFIGSKFCNIYNNRFFTSDFIDNYPNEYEIKLMKNIYEYVEHNPFVTIDELIKIFKIKSEKVIRFLDIKSMVWQISDAKRIQTLSEIADLGLNLYGTKSWLNDLPFNQELTLSYKNELVYSLQHNQDIYNSSKICININHIQAKSRFSWRVSDIMASDGCLVSEYKPDFAKLFPNIKIPLFTDKFEARKLCQKILSNENMRKDIIVSCNEIIDKSFRFKHVLEKIEAFTDINLTTSNKKTFKMALVCEVPLKKQKIRKKYYF